MSDEFETNFNFAFSIYIIAKDLATALSILYLHHRMGLKEMKNYEARIDIYTLSASIDDNHDLNNLIDDHESNRSFEHILDD